MFVFRSVGAWNKATAMRHLYSKVPFPFWYLYFFTSQNPLPHSPTPHPLTCAHKVSALSIAEVMEDFVSVGLCHAGVDEETRVP